MRSPLERYREQRAVWFQVVARAVPVVDEGVDDPALIARHHEHRVAYAIVASDHVADALAYPSEVASYRKQLVQNVLPDFHCSPLTRKDADK
ncbi:MAG: hypothetical protein IKL97_06595, partial [Eggerthellaceae bacterium]|nr:hypothetical protein [Eggerthellaceae bacterium]